MIKVNNISIDPKRIELHDGFSTTIDGKSVPYKIVILRPQTVAMDMQAIELAERLVMVNGVSTLKMSEEAYRIAMTMLRIERFECTDASIPPYQTHDINMQMVGRLHPYDLVKIEQQVFLFDMVESLRFGNITQAQFDAAFSNDKAMPKADQAPQHAGEAAGTEQMATKPRPPRPLAGRIDLPAGANTEG